MDKSKLAKNWLNYKKPRFWVVIVSLLLIVVVGLGLAGNSKYKLIGKPTGFSGINGVILAIDKNTKTMSVKGIDQNSAIGDKCIVNWENANLQIVEANNKLKELSIEDFAVGNQVVLFVDCIQETYPTSAKATTIQLMAEAPLNAMRPMIMVDGILYFDTNKVALGEIAASAVLGEVVSAVDSTKKPTKNGQVNFSAVGAKYAAYGKNIVVLLSDKWILFEPETAFVDPLEAAIHREIMAQNQGNPKKNQAENFACESHVVFATESKSPADNSAKIEETMVYAMVLYQEYQVSETGIKGIGGSHIPTVLTFEVNNQGEYSLKEYWQPRDGSYYAPDIKAKFPFAVQSDAMDTQKFIVGQVQNCYAQAMASTLINPEPIIAKLIQDVLAMSKANEIADWKLAVAKRELVYYGDFTLQYCFERFLEGGQTAASGEIMAEACRSILGDEDIKFGGKNGQEWFDAYLSSAKTYEAKKGIAFVEENLPKTYLLLRLAK